MPDLARIKERALACKKCSLSETRTQVVWGSGPLDAAVVFVGEAPGKNEDLGGEPFVGAAGKILDEFLSAADLSRDDVYIANTVKCRPPNNRNPLPEELSACSSYLVAQLVFIRPVIVVALGRFAVHALLASTPLATTTMKDVHGKLINMGQFKMLPVYHPAATIYNPRMREPFFEAAAILKQALDRT